MVCVEGTSHSSGSHGDIHSALTKNVVKGKETHWFQEPTIEYEEARDAAINSHKEVFPLSRCSQACLKAQLDNYRDKACGKGKNPDLKYVKIGKNKEEAI